MIVELMNLLGNFPGEANHTRCFTHIINLVAKSLLRQFDIPNKKADSTLNEAERILMEVAEGSGLEELETRLEDWLNNEDDDNDNGLVDEVAELTRDKREKLKESIWPVKLAQVKVIFNFTYRLRIMPAIHLKVLP